MSRRPILVTGSHRSGTTWVGEVLASAPRVGYIGEPFSLATPPGICRTRFEYWYTYVTSENEIEYLDGLEDTLRFRYDFRGALQARPGPRRAVRNLIDLTHFTRYRLRNSRPLMKDPLALFSAPWLADTFDMQVVVMIRHPAAFVASLKVKDWEFPFSDFVEQPALFRGPLSAYADEIMAMAAQPGDIIDQGILLWRIVHQTIAQYQHDHSDWVFLRLENLARNPLTQFSFLFDALGLEFTVTAANFIRSSSEGPKVGERGPVRGIVRNSESSLDTWRSRLLPDEIDRIRFGVFNEASPFYGDDDW